jgi:hypothetical protein
MTDLALVIVQPRLSVDDLAGGPLGCIRAAAPPGGRRVRTHDAPVGIFIPDYGTQVMTGMPFIQGSEQAQGPLPRLAGRTKLPM